MVQVERLLQARIEFLTSVIFQHLYFEYNVIDSICFSFSRTDKALKEQKEPKKKKAEVVLSNPYYHE